MNSPPESQETGGTYESVQEIAEQQSFLAQTFIDSRRLTLPYRILVPIAHASHVQAETHEADPERMPLVLLLHGSGERGNDNSAQLHNGVAELLGSETVAQFPCFYLVPQCPTEHRWVEVDWDAERHVLPLEPSATLSARWNFLTHSLRAIPSIRSGSTSSVCQWEASAFSIY